MKWEKTLQDIAWEGKTSSQKEGETPPRFKIQNKRQDTRVRVGRHCVISYAQTIQKGSHMTRITVRNKGNEGKDKKRGSYESLLQ